MGQSLNRIDTVLAPYARKSYDRYYKKHLERLENGIMEIRSPKEHKDETLKLLANRYADEDMRREIKDGVQTIQYQINTLMTTNGKSA